MSTSDFIHQIGKVPVPFEIGKIAHAKSMSPNVEDRGGGGSTRGGLTPLLLGGGVGGLPQKNFKI